MTTYSKSKAGRRAFLGAVLGTAALPAFATMAVAQSPNEAAALVNRVAADINRIINSGQPESAMLRAFEGVFDRYADVPLIARSALGPPARSASRQQLAAFGDAFGTYMARKYGARFREFIGGQIVVRDTRQTRNFVEVRSSVSMRGRSPFAVSFMVTDRSGSPKLFDIVIEGISLLQTERVEIGSMLDRRGGNIDALIQDLRRA